MVIPITITIIGLLFAYWGFEKIFGRPRGINKSESGIIRERARQYANGGVNGLISVSAGSVEDGFVTLPSGERVATADFLASREGRYYDINQARVVIAAGRSINDILKQSTQQPIEPLEKHAQKKGIFNLYKPKLFSRYDILLGKIRDTQQPIEPLEKHAQRNGISRYDILLGKNNAR